MVYPGFIPEVFDISVVPHFFNFYDFNGFAKGNDQLDFQVIFNGEKTG